MNAKELVTELTARGLKIVTVESCTGGALASAITDEHGASAVLEKAYVTYSNQAKIDLADIVDWGDQMRWVLKKHGVYSAAMATEMALLGKCHAAKTEFGVGITGTLSREDPANPGGTVGEVFYTVTGLGKLRGKKLTVPAGLTKPEVKQFVVNEVLQTLGEILEDVED
jgi:nicotinamide-nucleotide amidase